MKKTWLFFGLFLLPVQLKSWAQVHPLANNLEADPTVSKMAPCFYLGGQNNCLISSKYQPKDTDRFMFQTAQNNLKKPLSYFITLPQLLGAETTFYEVGFPNPTYFYYIQVPDRIGTGIKSIEILQEEGGEAIDYNPDRIVVKNLENIPIKTRIEGQKLTIDFAKPIELPQTITLSISPYQNPNLSGTYQFRVTALPGGESPRSQFLGYARFNFDRPIK